MKKTKIIATMGPAVENEENIIKMYNEWINIIRFNFSHAQKENVKKIATIIKNLNERKITNLSLLLDTKGPEIRTGDMKNPYHFKKWETFKIFVDEKKIEKDSDILCDYKYLIDDIQIWEKIIIDSGNFIVKVIEKKKNFLEVVALNNATMKSRRHINLPWVKLNFPGLTEKDKEDILFWIKENMDFIAASFIRSKKNVEEIRKFLDTHGWKHIKIISKIENEEGIENRKEIIGVSDGIMVARWDLWIEVPITKLPIYQKELVELCREAWKFVVVATHFLETMIVNPTPTRAETSDIANAVRQCPDSLMLSWETSVGEFAIESVTMMTDIIKESEKHKIITVDDYSNKGLTERDIEKKYLIKHGIKLANDIDAKAIIVFTKSWLLARLASMFRPDRAIYAFTNKQESFRFMNVLYSVQPFLLENWKESNYDDNFNEAMKTLINLKKIKKSDKIVVINDIQKGDIEIPILEIVNVGEYK